MGGGATEEKKRKKTGQSKRLVSPTTINLYTNKVNSMMETEMNILAIDKGVIT